jgi:aryl-alcohol dehydrogenase
MGAVIRGCAEIIAIDVLEPRLEMAKQLGATRVVHATGKLNTAEEIWHAVPGGVNYALDTTGRAATFDQAIASLATKGSFGFVTAPAGTSGLNLSAVMIGGQSVRGIVQGDSAPDAFIPYLIELHMSGRFPFDKLTTKYPFEQINQAIADQASGKVVKPVFTFPQ